MFIVRSGEVEIFVKNDQGEKIVLETSQPGDIFGEISLLDGGTRTAWVAALATWNCCGWIASILKPTSAQCTPAALNLLSVTARRLRRSDEVIRRTVTRNVNDVAAEQETVLTRLADAVPVVHRQHRVAGLSRGVSGRLDRDQSQLDPQYESLRSLSRSNSCR